MTVSSTDNKSGPYTGNGSTTVFAWQTFTVNDADHLKVYQTVDGTTTEVTSGITKSGVPGTSGNVTFSTAPLTGVQITIIREVPNLQQSDYSSQGSVKPDVIETDLDLLEMQIQDLAEKNGRAIRVGVTSGAVSDFTPNSQEELLGFDESGLAKTYPVAAFPNGLRPDVEVSRSGFFKDDDPSTKIYKVRDRMFVGDAAKHTGNRQGANGYGETWLTENGASYFEKNAQMVVSSAETGGRIGLVASSYTAVGDSSLVNMGIGAVTVNAGEVSTGRAGYFEGIHSGNASATFGLEVQMGNRTGTTPVANAYDASNFETIGIGIGAESQENYTTGDSDTVVSDPTEPCGVALDILGGSQNADYQKWVTGIVFRNGALSRDGNAHSTAISLAKGHALKWGISSSNPEMAEIRSDVATAGRGASLIFEDKTVALNGEGERHIVEAIDDISGSGAVNWMQLKNARTGIACELSVTGSDTNVSMFYETKGIGQHRFLSHEGSGENLRITPGVTAGVDYLTVQGSSGLAIIGSGGTSTNVDVAFDPKGTGGVRFAKSGGTDYLRATGGTGTTKIEADGDSANINVVIEPKGTGVLRYEKAVTAASMPAMFSAAVWLPLEDSSGTTYYIPLATAVW